MYILQQQAVIKKGKHTYRKECYGGKKNRYLKISKIDNPEMFLMYCGIHGAIWLSKNVHPVLDDEVKSLTKWTYAFKFNVK